MTLSFAVKAPPSPSRKATVIILLHFKGHYRLIERTLRNFQHLERQLEQEFKQSHDSVSFTSVLPAIEAYCDAKLCFYPSNQLGIRLAVALEEFLRRLVTICDHVTKPTALITFFDGSYLSSQESYQKVIDSEINADEINMMYRKVAAGCVVEYSIVVDEEQLIIWKFSAQGSGLYFSAEFSSGEEEETNANPYCLGSQDEECEKDQEVVSYRTKCKGENDYSYGHYVTSKRGVVTLQWENMDMECVVSMPLQFQVRTLALETAKRVLDVTNELNNINTTECLENFVLTSKLTSLENCYEWKSYDVEADMFGIHAEVDQGVEEDVERDARLDIALFKERTLQLEAQVNRLETSLAAAKKELKCAQDRLEITDEINKASLETIVKLERASTVGSLKPMKKADDVAAILPAGQSNLADEKSPSNELERAQQLCASFQEQCLWRSVENMELETHLAASQVEASSWRQKHVDQVEHIQKLEKQNEKLRAHKKMLVNEVKRLQPYSHVNLAALVQEAQEARMMQRSLQTKLDSLEQIQKEVVQTAFEANSSDFVLVEALDEDH
ncbi:Phox homologous domain [Plasmopara halstedii]|uniref:Phox homologous domain n=1 Tax=Plasmopara halstedii TaxID=4781 RepID=A0A0P1B768_PLAHL|nr:Phox homologous domain [Plasmopara halstedii]CEG50425.1 Phox homologous domain [Plasmopara halstedii]|eukprot:XP_024586794.1 Phox homologous domain [Plasmopara halstedii]